MKGQECSSSQVQIKDSGLTQGVDDETSLLQGAFKEIIKETLPFNFCTQA